MAKKNSGVQINKEHIVVKNKKFRNADILVFVFCLLAALVIWLYAKNVDIDEQKQIENIIVDKVDKLPTATQATEN